MNKKDDLPYFPFYIGDWRKATDLQSLPLETKAIWFEMLCYMWESTERGYLTVNKKPISNEALARMLGISEVLLEQNVKRLLDFGVASKREDDGAVFSRRMVKDQQIRKSRQKAGSLGGKKSFASRFATANTQANAENENENEDINESTDKEVVQTIEQHLLSEWGREGRVGYSVITKFVDLMKEHGKDKVFDAISESARHNKKSLAYVQGILKPKQSKPGELNLKRVGEK